MIQIILPDGFLAIAGLYAERVSYHGEGFKVHNGCDPENLTVLHLKAVCRTVHFVECYTMCKATVEGSDKSFPIFLLASK